MKIERVLEITSEEFYDYLEQQIVDEFEVSTNERITICEIKKGLNYSKQYSSNLNGINIEIVNYHKNHSYEAQITSANDVITISYTTEPMDGKLKVIFDQQIKSLNRSNMPKLFRMFSEGVYLGRMANTLYDIQDKIHKSKESESVMR